MAALNQLQITQGATLAPDGIPLHFGDLAGEYHAALKTAVLMDRSHEGRIELGGRDRLNLMQRISSNDLLTLAQGEGRPTVFTNANARILDRVTVYHQGETALVITEPGRGQPFSTYLRQNIFFNDDVRLNDLTLDTRQFALHGPLADSVMGKFIANVDAVQGMDVEIAGVHVFAARRKPLIGSHWVIVVPAEGADMVWRALTEAGSVPAGSLTYNTLRIRAGRPGVNRELSLDYIPLEIGLWDEVSFSKGCYTGQEIIARMESRNRLARLMVQLDLDQIIDSPATITHDGREVGTLTSSVNSPDGEIFAIAVIKSSLALPGQELQVGQAGVKARVSGLAGAPPPQMIADENIQNG
jgi:tRNA-modifying protein YgfZ